MSSSNLAEVDVEAQLKKAEESGDNESIVLSEKSDDDVISGTLSLYPDP